MKPCVAMSSRNRFHHARATANKEWCHHDISWSYDHVILQWYRHEGVHGERIVWPMGFVYWWSIVKGGQSQMRYTVSGLSDLENCIWQLRTYMKHSICKALQLQNDWVTLCLPQKYSLYAVLNVGGNWESLPGGLEYGGQECRRKLGGPQRELGRSQNHGSPAGRASKVAERASE